jgi:YD repeat-containing protein
VVWNTSVNDGSFLNELHFTRLDAQGNRVGAEIVVGSSYVNDSCSIAWNGNEFAIARRAPDGQIYVTRYDAAGNRIGGDIQVTVGATYARFPSLTATGSEFGLTWQDWVDFSGYEVYFARITSSGTVDSIVRVSDFIGSSEHPSISWSGEDYGIAWHDNRNGGQGQEEIYFNRITCCNDIDADGWTKCAADCDDRDSSVHPGAPELCDGKDNDCNGTVDDGWVTPGTTSGLGSASDKRTMDWNIEAQADGYDVTKGDLASVRSGGGFGSSVLACVENDSADTQSVDLVDPSPGSAFYYVVRAKRACKSGTYNSVAGSQFTDRDSGIATSPNRCP